MLVSQLITNSFRNIGVCSEARSLESYRLQEGFDTLNTLLKYFASDPSFVGFNDKIVFNIIAGQRNYEFSRLAPLPDYQHIDSNRIISRRSVSVVQNNMQYAIGIIHDYDFYNAGALSLQTSTAPYLNGFFRNQACRTLLEFVQIPAANLACTIIGKFVISPFVTFQDVVDELVPEFFIQYLIKSLGRKLHELYLGSKWDEVDENAYQAMDRDVKAASDFPNTNLVGGGLRSNFYRILSGTNA